MLEVGFERLSLGGALGACLGLALLFVLSLYAVDERLPRNHPRTVRRRVGAITGVCAVSPLYVWLWSDWNPLEKGGTPLWSLLGFKWAGLVPAALVAVVLVGALYTGPLFQLLTSPGESLIEHIWCERTDICLRNFLVAPFAEEFVFRACMVPLLLPHLGAMATVLLCPLFFGLAHTHHLVEWCRCGSGSLAAAAATTLAQVGYTSLFGSFSAFLFLRSGHLLAPVLSHTLCNMMGLPPLDTVPAHPHPRLVGVAYMAGLLGFLALLLPATRPELFA